MYDININYLELVQHGCRLSDVVRDQNSRTNLLRQKRYNNGRNAECQSEYDERRKDNERDHLTTTSTTVIIITKLLYARRRVIVTCSPAGCNLFELTIYIFTIH